MVILKKIIYVLYSFTYGCVGSFLPHVLFFSRGGGGYSPAAGLVQWLLLLQSRALGSTGSAVVLCRLPMCRAQAQRLCCVDSLCTEHRLSSCDAWARCPMACGILTDPGSNLCPLHWQVDSQLLDHQGSPYFLTSHTPHPRIVWGAGLQNRHSLAM